MKTNTVIFTLCILLFSCAGSRRRELDSKCNNLDKDWLKQPDTTNVELIFPPADTIIKVNLNNWQIHLPLDKFTQSLRDFIECYSVEYDTKLLNEINSLNRGSTILNGNSLLKNDRINFRLADSFEKGECRIINNLNGFEAKSISIIKWQKENKYSGIGGMHYMVGTDTLFSTWNLHWDY